MILVINICEERLHYFEFVKPIEDVLRDEFFTKHYLEVSEEDLEKADKVIICGTSLKDFDYFNNLDKFDWLLDFEKPILGICAGCQIVGNVFNENIKDSLEIGFFNECLVENFLGSKGEIEVYHLHSKYVNFGNNFESFCDGKIHQAIKHKEKEIYGTLFHPEVRNKEMILNFVKL